MITKIKKSMEKVALSPNKFRIFLIFSLLPLLFVCCHIFFKEKKILDKEKKLDELYASMVKTKKFRNFQKQILKRTEGNNPAFIEENILSLSFLKEEITAIENYLKCTPFKNSYELKKRHKFLTQGDNRLAFNIEKIQEKVGIDGSAVKLSHPVETSFDDLLHLLSLIENVPINNHTPLPVTPIMVVTKLEIKKAKNSNLSIKDLSLIKRDFSKGK